MKTGGRYPNMAGGIAGVEERIIERAAAQEQALAERLDAATSGVGVGQVQRKQSVTNALVAAGDPQTMQRLEQYKAYMTERERATADRRVARGAPDAPVQEGTL